MKHGMSRVAIRRRRRAIAAGVASAFSVCACSAVAQAVWTVDSCDDADTGDLAAKSGTLRFTVKRAASGDTVDLSTLSCSTISLSSGAIRFGVDDLTIAGATPHVTIDGKQNGSAGILYHGGSGTLTLRNVDLAYGNYRAGGCVYSYGSVTLDHARVSHCTAQQEGGGVRAFRDVTLLSSTISQCTVFGSTVAHGGGVVARRYLHAEYSTIDANATYVSNSQYARASEGGGVFASGVFLKNSTVSNNYSYDAAGLAVVTVGLPAIYLHIESSTISGNHAGHFVGGIYVDAPLVQIYSSTIASNVSAKGNFQFATGLVASSYFGDASLTLANTLISDNTLLQPNPLGDGSYEYDFSLVNPSPNQSVTFTAASSHNFVRRNTAAGIPADTITGASACPLLGPLRDNGGPTKTHALLSGSPAIDLGSNPLGSLQDQRGSPADVAPPYPYPRVSNGSADIGAYELQQDDQIFSSGAEGCTAIPP